MAFKRKTRPCLYFLLTSTIVLVVCYHGVDWGIRYQQLIGNFHSKLTKPMSRDQLEGVYRVIGERWNRSEQEANSQFRRLLHRQDGSHCVDSLCTNYLSDVDWYNFTACRMRTALRLSRKDGLAKGNQRHVLPTNLSSDHLTSGNCGFINGSDRDTIGLVSFPGSGNTWVRSLLQSATGMCTGSVYCDIVLRSNGFDGEGVQSSSVIVIKDHSPTVKWNSGKRKLRLNKKGRPYYDKIIFIIRNPFQALVSEWNRQLSTKFGLRGNTNSSHTDSFEIKYFGSSTNWDRFVRLHIVKWVQMFDWITGSPSEDNLLVVLFENLKKNYLSEVKRMLQFLDFPLVESDLGDHKTYKFHRQSKYEFDHFTKPQRDLINNSIKTVIESLQDKLGHFYRINEYFEE